MRRRLRWRRRLAIAGLGMLVRARWLPPEVRPLVRSVRDAVVDSAPSESGNVMEAVPARDLDPEQPRMWR